MDNKIYFVATVDLSGSTVKMSAIHADNGVVTNVVVDQVMAEIAPNFFMGEIPDGSPRGTYAIRYFDANGVNLLNDKHFYDGNTVVNQAELVSRIHEAFGLDPNCKVIYTQDKIVGVNFEADLIGDNEVGPLEEQATR